MRNGVILSNDFYRDLLQDSGDAVRKAIRERCICYFQMKNFDYLMIILFLDYYVIDLLEIIYVYLIQCLKEVYH
jgi:hypothetical protein